MDAQGFTIYDLLVRGASLHRDAPALIQGARQWSFRQLVERADQLAAGLASLGLSKGDRLCILAQNDVGYVDLYGACARQGIIAYPINWRLTGPEVERVLERASPTMMVADASTLPVVGEWPRAKREVAHWYQLGEAAAAPGFTALSTLYRADAPAPAAGVAGDDPFAVISTAAVDVIPRGAVLTHANVVTASLVVIQSLGFTAADRYLLALPLFHVTALSNLVAHLHAGGACVLVARYDAEEAVRLIDAHRITHLSDFPPVLVNLLDAAQKLGSKLPSLKHVSGLDAPPTIQRLHDETQAQFWTGFGQSETSGFVSLQRVRDKPGAAGRPIPVCRVRLVDDYDREVPTGTPGEIVVRGPVVFQGYFGQPDVTAYTLRNGWHHTGDVGRFDDEGWLYYVRRKPEKELIKPGGENVYPAEVESVIVQMEGVAAACVYGIPDVKWGEAIKAVVEVRPADRYTAQHVIDFVGGKIARFKRPHAVAFTDALPRAADGTVDREAVKVLWGERA
ncbi:MAG TPA: AMP-binding protein [Methylomirabilota bacterium]|nr:AMP-binding protein [Methylomirabilota bacterium]